jgi:HEAT repeat protein
MTLMSGNTFALDLNRSLEGNSDAACDLLSRLVSNEPETQTEITEVLEASREPELWRLLLEVLALHTWRGNTTPVAEATGQDPRRLEFSIRGLFCNLVQTPAQRAKIAVLRESLDHDDLNIRCHAALLLGRRRDRAALPYLIDILNSGNEVWAIPAAIVLGEERYSQAADALVDAIASNLPGLHRAAVQALEELGRPAVPALIRALQHSDDHVRWHAARALGKIRAPQAISALIEALDDMDSGVRWLVGEALIRQGDKALEPLLQNLMHKPLNAFRRNSAIHVLHHFQLKGLHIVAPVVEALTSVDYGTSTPIAAYKLLQELRKIKSSQQRLENGTQSVASHSSTQ